MEEDELRVLEEYRIFKSVYCKRCEDCTQGEDCCVTKFLDGKVTRFGSSIYSEEEDLCVYDDGDRDKARELFDRIMSGRVGSDDS